MRGQACGTGADRGPPPPYCRSSADGVISCVACLCTFACLHWNVFCARQLWMPAHLLGCALAVCAVVTAGCERCLVFLVECGAILEALNCSSLMPSCAPLCVRHWFDQELLTEALKRYATAPKLWMMAGQLAEDQGNVDGARGLYQRGTKLCPTSIPLWKLAARLEVRCFAAAASLYCLPTPHPQPVGVVVVVLRGVSQEKAGAGTKARAILEFGRLQNRKNPELWVESVRLELRTGNEKLATSLLAQALQVETAGAAYILLLRFCAVVLV